MEQQAALKQELLALENRYWNAIKQKDSEVAVSLSDDPCLVVGAQGVGEIDRSQLAQMLEAASYELKDFALGDVRLRRLSEDVVALAYEVNEHLTVAGENLGLKAYDLSIWTKRNGGWVCVIHTESPAGDPFGRH